MPPAPQDIDRILAICPTYIYMYMHICMYMYMYPYMYLYMYVYTYMYKYGGGVVLGGRLNNRGGSGGRSS